MEYIKQKDIDIILQQNKAIYHKLEILNSNMKVIDSIEGNLISDNLSIDSSSSVRRTYTCQMVLMNKSYLIGNNSNVRLFNKFVRPYIGIRNERSQEIQWYLLGTFLFCEEGFEYNCNTNTISLTCKDIMCLLDDTRNGQIDQYKRKLLADSDVRTIIINLLETIEITKYYIEFNINGESVSTYSLPYDITYEIGTTIFKIIDDLVNMYPGTQCFFDKNGIFNIRRVPTKNDEKSILDNNILSQIVISESNSISFTDVRNKIIIWGKVNTPDYYSTNVNMIDSTYNVTIDEDKTDEDETNWIQYDSYERGDKISIKIPCSNISSPKININNLGEIPIEYEDGRQIESGKFSPNEDYIFRLKFKDDNSKVFVFIGQYQCYGEAWLTNYENNSPYAVYDPDNDLSIEKIKTLTKVFSGNDFDNIYTDTLAIARAKKELYNYTNLKENLTLNTLLIPWLDVNQKITYKSNTTNQECDYLISNISCDTSKFTMTITLNKFFPDYI